jgi:hypothetical protein
MFKKTKIANIVFLVVMTLGYGPSGKAMQEEEDREDSCDMGPMPLPRILVNEILYETRGNEALVTKQVGKTENLFLPSSVFDLRNGNVCYVTFIKDDSFSGGALREITIPRTVKALGDRCFYGCQFLVTVSFETNSQLVYIGEESFRNSALISMAIPKNVREIGGGCFRECRMKSISFERQSQLRVLRKEAFYEAHLESICLPCSIEILERGCFHKCFFLTSTSFEPNSQLQEIGIHAFCHCRSLANISFEMEPRSQWIERWAFADGSLRKVMIPRRIEILQYGCFSGCKNLESVLFEPRSQLRRIEAYAFINTGLRGITIPKTVKILERACLSDCCSLTNVFFEADSQLRQIEERAFSSSSLKAITIPCYVETLGTECFSRCPFLREISFEVDSQLRSVGTRAFERIPLKTIVIPRYVEALGTECFSHCPFLREVSFEANSQLWSVGMRAFERIPLKKVTLPKSVEILGMGSFCGCCRHLEVVFEEGSQLRTVENGAFALSRQLKEHRGYPSYSWDERPGRFCLPEGVVAIGLLIGYENVIIRRAPEEIFIGCHFNGRPFGERQSYVFSPTARQLSSLLNEHRDWPLMRSINNLPLPDYFESLGDHAITVRLVEDGSSLQRDTVLQSLREASSRIEHVSTHQMMPFPSEKKAKEKCLLF